MVVFCTNNSLQRGSVPCVSLANNMERQLTPSEENLNNCLKETRKNKDCEDLTIQ